MAEKNTRNTPQRTCILAVLRDSPEPLSAEEVHGKARETLPTLALTTVYRNLEALAGKGILRRTMHPDGVARYDFPPARHTHSLVCLGCHKTIPLEHCPLHEMEETLSRETGFSIEEHHLEFYGYCPECKDGH